MKNLNYWDEFYSKVYNPYTSQFAIFIANEYQGNNTLVISGVDQVETLSFLAKFTKCYRY